MATTSSGQTLNDRINSARYALAGQGLARCVCKATTEEVIGPKKKHLDYLVACTHEPNVSVPQLANLLIERTNHIYWVVVFKALVTVHHLMSYGNERFIQYLASSNYSFELSTFLDKTAARDFSMSTFIRRYSRYINEKALSYRLLAFDFCKVKRGNEGVLRTMPIDRLLKTLPILQDQLDALLEFDCSASDLNNGVINACFMLLFRDLIGLFACHNDGIINLLNKYFTLNKKMCREAFDLYKKFLVRMDKVSDFLRVAEVVGIDKDEIPDLRRAPSSLIDALEQHLQNLETNKKTLKQSSSNSNNNSNNRSSGDSTLLGNLTPPSSLATASGSPVLLNAAGGIQSKADSPANQNSTTSLDEFTISGLKDDEVRKALEEEARVLSHYHSNDNIKSKSHLKVSSIASSSSSATTPSRDNNNSPKFAVDTTPITIDDIFGDVDSFSTTNTLSSKNNIDCKPGPRHAELGTSNFNNINNTSSSSIAAKQLRPNIETIKSAIKSATCTLETANINKSIIQSNGGNKSSSADLFSLLDSSALTSVPPQQVTSASSQANSSNLSNPSNPISPYDNLRFDLPSNGHQTVVGAMKPGNPFPQVTSTFQVGFTPSTQMHATNSTTIGSNIFGCGSQPGGANYTNLGGLEGFGDVLQPTPTSGKSSNVLQQTGGTATKPNFGASSSLSTGLFKGDLDSTLANLAQNLTFELTKSKK